LSIASYRYDVNQGIDNVNCGCYNCYKVGLKYFERGILLLESSNPRQGKGLAVWLEERCKKDGLSLRQAAQKTGLSHATIADIIKGVHPSAETIKKLAEAFSQSGDHHRMALEDNLLVLAGYRSERPKEKELTEPMARLLDKLSEFNEPQLKIMGRFADFISQVEVK